MFLAMRFLQARRERHQAKVSMAMRRRFGHVLSSVVMKGFRIGVLHGFGTDMIPVCFLRDIRGRVGESCAGITIASRPWTLLDHGFAFLRLLVPRSGLAIGWSYIV